MADYSYSQLEGLWIQAGGPRDQAATAAAIAEAESGGNSDARNPSGASGLWQILGVPFPGNPFDPATNAKMAVAKWKSQGLGAWVTYTDGAYKAYLSNSTTPDPSVPGSPSATATLLSASQTADCAIGTGNLNPVPSWVPGLGGSISVCLVTKSNVRSWLAVGNMIGGAIIAGVGLGFVLAFTRAGRAIIAFIPGGQAAASGAASAASRIPGKGTDLRAAAARGEV